LEYVAAPQCDAAAVPAAPNRPASATSSDAPKRILMIVGLLIGTGGKGKGAGGRPGAGSPRTVSRRGPLSSKVGVTSVAFGSFRLRDAPGAYAPSGLPG